jgi:exosortase/archaeosortase family protein
MSLLRELFDSLVRKYRQLDFWLNCSLFLCLGAAFWPLTSWFAQTAHDQSRIFNALAVLALAAIFLIRFGNVPVRNTLELNQPARHALFAAYGLLLTSYIAQFFPALPWLNLLIIPAYCCALASAVRFIFGAETRRITATVASTLCVFILISIWMAPLDWPLRSLAGQWSHHALELIGQNAELGLFSQKGSPPMLILVVNEHPFHVASECNGFGVILTSLLIATLLAIHRRRRFLGLGLNLLIGVAIGFAFNILRIVIIVLLAPSLMDHYDLMHETVGGITYWGCLVAIWILLRGPTKPEPSEVPN